MREDYEDWEEDADEAFGEDVEGAGCGEGVAEEWIWWMGGLLGTPVREEGQGEPEADDGVGDDDAGEDEDAEAGEKEESSVEACACACEGSAGEGFEEDG